MPVFCRVKDWATLDLPEMVVGKVSEETEGFAIPAVMRKLWLTGVAGA